MLAGAAAGVLAGAAAGVLAGAAAGALAGAAAGVLAGATAGALAGATAGALAGAAAGALAGAAAGALVGATTVSLVWPAVSGVGASLYTRNSPVSLTIVAVTKISRYRGLSTSVRRRNKTPMSGISPSTGTDSTNVDRWLSKTPPITTVSPEATVTRVASSCVRYWGKLISNVFCNFPFTS